MSKITFLFACLVALVAVQFCSAAQINLVLTQNVVKSMRHIPSECFMPGAKCGDMTTYFNATKVAKAWFDVPEPPTIIDPTARKAEHFYIDYHMCNYTTHKDFWVTFPWGDELQYINILDGLDYVNCLWGMCDDHVFFGGYKYGCVAAWRTRTFMALWYKKNQRAATYTRCFNRWCFVNVRITYPESCKCAQLYECEAPWMK